MKLSTTVLAVSDLGSSVAFYERLGLKRQQGGGALAFLSDGERTIALTKADVVGMINGAGSVSGTAPGVVLAYLARTAADVDATLADAVAAGGRILREAEQGAWGGYSGSFADLDGHVWAVIHNEGLYRG